MRNIGIVVFVPVMFIITALMGTASAYTESSTDLWNYQNISNLAYYKDNILSAANVPTDIQLYNVFGTNNSNGDGTSTLFEDSYPAGMVFSLRLTLNSAVTVKSFNLLAAHDDGGYDATHRGFKQFSLYSSTDGVSWGSALYIYDATNPYNPPLNGVDYNVLDLARNIDPTTARYWRADFVQMGAASHFSAPRVGELDGFATTVPEPVSTALFILGGATLAIRRMRRK